MEATPYSRKFSGTQQKKSAPQAARLPTALREVTRAASHGLHCIALWGFVARPSIALGEERVAAQPPTALGEEPGELYLVQERDVQKR